MLQEVAQQKRVSWIVLLLALTVACSSSTSPSPTLAGIWSEAFSIPGAKLLLTLDPSGNGLGNYVIEAGRSGSIQIAGTVSSGNVTLTLRYDNGTSRTFVGMLVDSDHLTGVFQDTAGTVVFTRQ